MELAIYTTTGTQTEKKAVLSAEVFGVEPNAHAIYLAVKQYLADQRQGTHKAKQRNEVAGSTRKLKRQKGTGGARAGSILSPLFPGGGRIFGPVPRDYSFKLNKKLKGLARRSALSIKAQNEAITVVEDFVMETPKTKSFVAMAEALNLAGKKVLLVVAETDHNISLSVRNLPKVKVMQVANLNTYDVMNAGVMLFTESALAKANEVL
ncbi:MAG: 50S ribosomal protein L4 [Rikenellaceae bacterium]|nr:50S ribosomal protein L4 [Tidjanibacter sp.]MBR2442794.1 50S ribosomal protein L4 [Rikenellaceae bacterium]MBQ3070904.1 50S ribosomal protein L4 [Tidjanibacter sp.]MBR1958582.1 50S ribosomal protein L4 [Tidjanibacter sp.]MBR3682069.1 50S ribosomal protein L4 [Tidjanibacter sp.]